MRSIRYDADGLRLASPWRRNRFVPWSAITGARFSPPLQWYVLSTTGLGYVRLDLYLSGLQSLLDELTTRGVSIRRCSARPVNEYQNEQLSSESPADSRQVRPHGIEFSDRQLLLWSSLALVVALHGWATMHSGWSRLLVILPFSVGCVTYPTLLYVTVRTATERRISLCLSFAVVAALAAFALGLLSLYLVIHPNARNA